MSLDEYREMDIIDHSADYFDNRASDAVTCIFFDYPDTARDQVKFVIQMMSACWNTYWCHKDVYMYKFDNVHYMPLCELKNERKLQLQGAVEFVGEFAHFLWHNDKRSYLYEGKWLKQFKQTIAAMLPDNSEHGRLLVSNCIDQLLRIRRRRTKRYGYYPDENGENIKWRPVHKSVLDDISRSDTKRPLTPDVQPTNASLTNYRYMFAFCGIGPNDVEPITERICEIMGVDVQVRAWTMDEFREQRDYIAQTNNTDFETEFLVCVFIKDFPSSTYGKVKFMIRMCSSLMHDYDLLMDVLKYTNRNGKFEFETYKVNTLRYAFYFDGYLQRLKYGTAVEKNAVSYAAEQLRANIIPLMYDNVSIYDETHNDEVDAILNKMVERAVHGNQALLESVLDNIERSDMNQHDYSDVQSDTRDILDYKMMYMFGSGKNISQKELERSAVYDIADIMDIDICIF